MQIYQWLVPAVALYYIVRLVRQLRHDGRLIGSTVVWIVFWLTCVLLALMPDLISDKIADLLGFKSNVNAVIFVALGLLFVFMFYLTAVVERLERQFTETIRKLALENERLVKKLEELHRQDHEDSLRP